MANTQPREDARLRGGSLRERPYNMERWNDGMAEWRNGRISPQILKDGMTENRPQS